MREPVLFSAVVKARNACFTSLVEPEFAIDVDASSTTWMSMPHDATRSGFDAGVSDSPGAATAGPSLKAATSPALARLSNTRTNSQRLRACTRGARRAVTFADLQSARTEWWRNPKRE